MKSKTLSDCHIAMRAAFRSASLPSADLDARLLAEHIAAVEPGKFVLADGRIATDGEISLFRGFANRRLAGEPVARITGVKEFWSLDFLLNEAMLIPRPETEHLVEQTLQVLPRTSGKPLLVADIGTGSGAILVAILSERSDVFGIGVDLSMKALKGARDNARRHQVGNRASFVLGSFTSCLRNLDVVVSNPPYIPTSEIAALEVDVREHDPRLALDGGVDGLDAYRNLIPQAKQALKSGGWLCLEVGQGEAGDVAELLELNGYSNSSIRNDLSGIPRVVMGRSEKNDYM